MSPRRRGRLRLDLEELPPDLAAVLDAAVAGEEVTLTRSDAPLGTLVVRSSTLEGVVRGTPRTEVPRSVPEGATVVATAMELSEGSRQRISEELGAGYIVLDLHEAPSSADVLLVPPISPQLVGALRGQFPDARLLVTEIEDEELGVHYAGPVGRMLEAGASGYLPPRPVAELAATVHAHLARQDALALEASAAVHQQTGEDRTLTD
ncbi:hypothetical protein BH708_12905 [Brachybacterium sp. P6-10-X1]|uniref:hypothetical protein n=1 Tax=Brachybacterium sp. P6-10-X1 TaxID=1903186 RepID=UPI000971B927|nr:hypothetical protein [Brachybacterium sp. P6-10-X1]APX33466.1 hypothetical protein BH708_12905 [Brachybacterium sp. P6-10-X1]